MLTLLLAIYAVSIVWLAYEAITAPLYDENYTLISSPTPITWGLIRCFLRHLADPETPDAREAWEMARLDMEPSRCCTGCGDELPLRFFEKENTSCDLCNLTGGNIRQALREAGRLDSEIID